MTLEHAGIDLEKEIIAFSVLRSLHKFRIKRHSYKLQCVDLFVGCIGAHESLAATHLEA